MTDEMKSAPRFFVPAATEEERESVYAEMAAICGRAVPPLDRRIYSITYVHDGEEWTATVGEQLRGTRPAVTNRRGKKVQREQRFHDPAKVLAIFAGYPYMVFTNHRVGGRSVHSAWENPFLAGTPKSVIYFSS
jgi:hypothetical protein